MDAMFALPGRASSTRCPLGFDLEGLGCKSGGEGWCGGTLSVSGALLRLGRSRNGWWKNSSKESRSTDRGGRQGGIQCKVQLHSTAHLNQL